ncbi:MAG: hypothetical protein M0Z70_10135 [Nitrospiraceae bacterium]|nr:hypothetical protein [Nitrospirota bacterium]MDA8339644.1 hypothetical protein [Nitrospiraceae bacterium]
MRLKRYEILLPLLYNDGQKIEKEKFLITNEELVNRFGAATTDSTRIVGRWIYYHSFSDIKTRKDIKKSQL